MPSQVNIAGATFGNNIQLSNSQIDVWSKEILFRAQPRLMFEQIASMRTELGGTPGSTIKFVKFSSLTGGSAILETDTILTQALSTSTVSISVGEHAKAVAMSELLLKTSFLDVMGNAATLLGMDYAKNRDALIRDVLMAFAQIKYSQAGGATANRAGLTAGSGMNVSLIRDAVELLSVNKAPKFGGESYWGYVHPHQGRQLRDDPAWVNVNLYASPDNIMRGEIGRIEDVRFIETTMIPKIPAGTQDIWADNIDTGTNTAVAANAATDVYRAVVVGEYAVGMAEVLPVELRDNGVVDFGRTHALGYYGIWGAGAIEDGHAVVLETA